MAKPTASDLAQLRIELEKSAALQKRISENAVEYLELIKDIKNITKDINATEKITTEISKNILDINNKLSDAKNGITNLTQDELDKLEDSLDVEKAKLDILNETLQTLQKTKIELAKAARETNKMGAAWLTVKKDIFAINNAITFGYGKIKNWAGLFDMDKAIRTSANQMGILSKQGDSFRNSIELAANKTISFGLGMADLAKIQSDYSSELGRTVMLGEDGLTALGEMSIATSLGAEATSKMAADMASQGYSAERIGKFMNKTMDDAHKMGLDASKVAKTIQSNVKMLNKYNFKDGTAGLAKMVQSVTKLGIDMNAINGMADKLFDIEGAVDMSAQLQVMGGEWSKLADPFKLMFMARNDMNGLVEAIGKASESAVHFNSKSKEFEISGLEMHRLRKIAEQTGVAYEELAQAGRNAAIQTKLKKQIGFQIDDETKDFLSKTAQFDENGNGYIITLDGSKKLLKELSSSDGRILKGYIQEQKSLKERAEASATFDDKLTSVILQFKQLLLPLLTEIDKGLRPVIQQLNKTLSNPETVKEIRHAAEVAGKAIALIGKFAANNPMTAIAGLGLFEIGKWYLNGRALGMGFNSVANGGGSSGGMGGGMFDFLGGKGKGGKMSMNGKLASAGIGAGATIGANLIRGGLDDGNSEMGKILGVTEMAATGASLGSFGGGWGMAIGGGLGALLGAYQEYGGGSQTSVSNDGIHDGIVGGHFSKGRAIIDGGKITPIDNKDDLLAMKPGGPVDKTISKDSGPIKVEFGELKFHFDELKVVNSNGQSVSIDLLRDPQFIREITRMVHSETDKAINGGRNKG